MRERETLTAARAERIDAYLASCTELTRSAAQRLIQNGDVTVNGRAVKPRFLVNVGDAVEIVYPEPEPIAAEPEDIPLDVVYEDADIAVIDKPQGMVVHPAPGHASGTLVNALLYRLTDLSGVGGAMRPGIVHRIDRMTSGLLVVAKNDMAHTALSKQFADHSAHRSYIALVEGNLRTDAGTVDVPIMRHPTDRKRMAAARDGRGREARTHYCVIERLTGFTLIEAELETGRTHQIRVHMASIGHPLAGDVVYGRNKPQLGLLGQALHGFRLTLAHPATKERMTFFAPPPDYFMEALRRAGSRLDAPELMKMLQTDPIGSKENA